MIRMALLPVLVLVYFLPWMWTRVAATAIFVVAAITDWLDGHLARRWNQSSPFGAFLDPVADKLIVALALVLLVSDAAVLHRAYSQGGFIVATLIIICREIIISALREWMAELGKRASVSVNTMGKLKTVMQFVAIALLLFAGNIGGIDFVRLGEICLYAAAAMTLWSMLVYLKAAWPALSER